MWKASAWRRLTAGCDNSQQGQRSRGRIRALPRQRATLRTERNNELDAPPDWRAASRGCGAASCRRHATGALLKAPANRFASSCALCVSKRRQTIAHEMKKKFFKKSSFPECGPHKGRARSQKRSARKILMRRFDLAAIRTFFCLNHAPRRPSASPRVRSASRNILSLILFRGDENFTAPSIAARSLNFISVPSFKKKNSIKNEAEIKAPKSGGNCASLRGRSPSFFFKF